MGLTVEGEECQELGGAGDSGRPVEHLAKEFLQAMDRIGDRISGVSRAGNIRSDGESRGRGETQRQRHWTF